MAGYFQVIATGKMNLDAGTYRFGVREEFMRKGSVPLDVTFFSSFPDTTNAPVIDEHHNNHSGVHHHQQDAAGGGRGVCPGGGAGSAAVVGGVDGTKESCGPRALSGIASAAAVNVGGVRERDVIVDPGAVEHRLRLPGAAHVGLGVHRHGADAEVQGA